jgi:ferredoxin
MGRQLIREADCGSGLDRSDGLPGPRVCYRTAPEVFYFDGDGYGVVRVRDVPESHTADAWLAVNSRPERAISASE